MSESIQRVSEGFTIDRYGCMAHSLTHSSETIAGLEYSAISLLSTLLMLYVAFSCNKFKLDRKVGYACLLMYGVFLILASLIELNVFFPVNMPTCGR